MESLNSLAKSLPSSSIAKAEQDLTDNFKAAALSLTTLYRGALNSSRRYHDAGYATALEDVLAFIQQGVCVAGTSEGSNGAPPSTESGLTIGRVMDHIEARLEAIRLKMREDEEDVSEETRRSQTQVHSHPPPSQNHQSQNQHRERGMGSSIKNSSSSGVNDARDKASPATKTKIKEKCAMENARQSTSASAGVPAPTAAPTSASASVATSDRTSSASIFPAPSTSSPSSSSPPSYTSTVPFSPSVSPNLPRTPASASTDKLIGAKRRHTAMILDSRWSNQTSASTFALPPSRFDFDIGPGLGLASPATAEISPSDVQFISSSAGPGFGSGYDSNIIGNPNPPLTPSSTFNVQTTNAGTPRRRTRSSRGAGGVGVSHSISSTASSLAHSHQLSLGSGDSSMMDVEEEDEGARERGRKRVARR